MSRFSSVFVGFVGPSLLSQVYSWNSWRVFPLPWSMHLASKIGFVLCGIMDTNFCTKVFCWGFEFFSLKFGGILLEPWKSKGILFCIFGSMFLGMVTLISHYIGQTKIMGGEMGMGDACISSVLYRVLARANIWLIMQFLIWYG